MMRRVVTITGADEAVPPGALLELSLRYPVVEWAFLFSKTQAGGPRYPRLQWIEQAAGVLRAHPSTRMSLHLCGSAAAETMLGNPDHLLLAERLGFQRVQLNGWKPSDRSRELLEVTQASPLEIILQSQTGNVELAQLYALAIRGLGGTASVLVDPSGGTGKPIGYFPQPIVGGVPFGYAGGIGEHNIATTLRKVRPLNGEGTRVWLDMESSVRTGCLFDLSTVARVLELATAEIATWGTK